MGHKIRPDSYRLGIVIPWKARWFGGKSLKKELEEDWRIRRVVNGKASQAGIVQINIERFHGDVKVSVKVARPGLMIGRGGKGIEELIKAIKKELAKMHRRQGSQVPSISVNVEELKRTEIAAPVMAQNVAWDLEKRMPYRRILKKHLDLAMQNKEIKGAKVMVGGRLGGAEIARREWLSRGKLPLQTLRANIDYGTAIAYTTYGTIGVKVWIYKGEVFSEDNR